MEENEGDALAVTLLLSLITFFILVTNFYVIFVTFTHHSLKVPQNVLLISLAFSDFALSIFVLPFDIIIGIFGEWPLDQSACIFWVSCDITLCTASILSLVAISLDRYWAITDSINYIEKRTYNRMYLMTLVVWLISVGLSVIPGFIADLYKDGECSLCKDPIYIFASSIVSFYSPIFVLVVVYSRIYSALKKRRAEKLKKMANVFGKEGGELHFIEMLKNKDISSTSNDTKLDTYEHVIKRKYRFFMSKEKRASITLSILMISFIVCWLPFSILYLMEAFLPGLPVPHQLERALVWLGYSNSLLNPFIYSITNKDLRKAFLDVLVRSFRCVGYLFT